MKHYPFINTPLPYDYNGLEPYIDEKTMHLHHDKHLQTYVDNLNAALKAYPNLQNLTLRQLIVTAPKLNKNIGIPISRNAGGVYNHRFYFDGMTPSMQSLSDGVLKTAIYRNFGNFENFQKQFSAAALSVFGSGYAWLVTDRYGNLKIITTANQETPLTMGLCPIMNIDVWEHSYYLKYYNKRANYIDGWWNVVNFPKVEERYLQCTHRQ